MAYSRFPAVGHTIEPASMNIVPSSITKEPTAINNVPSGRFSSLVTSVSVLLSIQSDMLVTLNGSTVSAWGDLAVPSNSFTQGTAAKQPTYTTAALNGYPVIAFDGSNDEMTSGGPNLPTPSTTNSWFWFVIKQNTWTVGKTMIKTIGASAMSLSKNGVTPQMNMTNGTGVNLNGGAATTQWVRGEMFYSNSTSDYLKLGTTTVTGASAGNNDPSAGIYLGRDNAGAVFAEFSIAALLITAGQPSTSEKNALSAAVTAKYGSSVLV